MSDTPQQVKSFDQKQVSEMIATAYLSGVTHGMAAMLSEGDLDRFQENRWLVQKSLAENPALLESVVKRAKEHALRSMLEDA